MDKKSLHDLLDAATVPDPPVGAMPQNAMRAGIRLRRRRRARYGSVGAATAAVACAATLTVAPGIGRHTAASASGTIYVLGNTSSQGTVTPISAATNTPGQPIVVRTGDPNYLVPDTGPLMAVTPDGKTIWATDGAGTVTAISTATKKAEKTITVLPDAGATVGTIVAGTRQILATPDGKTVYVMDSRGTVTPISTATDQPGTPIRLGPDPSNGYQMAITPDGRTLYVLDFNYQPGTLPSYVIPIDTATGRPGAPIRVPTYANWITVTPDGRTAYVIGESATGSSAEVTPIATATNTPGSPVAIGPGAASDPVMAPDGQSMYLEFSQSGPALSLVNWVVPFSTVTNRPGKLISLGSAVPSGMAIRPDGRTLYVSTGHRTFGLSARLQCLPEALLPISTVSGTVGKPIRVACPNGDIAITPDGRWVYVGSALPARLGLPSSGFVTPVATSINRPGKRIVPVGAPEEILIAP